MAAQVSLAVSIDIKLSDHNAAHHWTLPDARVDSFAAPADIAWQTDVNGYNPCYHFFSRRFAGVPQTAWSPRKNPSDGALPRFSLA
jgi:hypothetical protein